MNKYRVRIITNYVDVVRGIGAPEYSAYIVVDAPSNSHEEIVDAAKKLKPEWKDCIYDIFNISDFADAQAEGLLVLRYRNGRSKHIAWDFPQSRMIFTMDPDIRGLDVADIISVRASGAFLQVIRDSFHNLPDRIASGEEKYYQEPITWYCDDAKFIVGNLKVD